MLKFISFGSGSSGNCYLLATKTDALLIDIGVGLRGLKKACRDYGVSLSSVKHVLVTHDHADHIKSVGAFSNDYQVSIYATREVHDGINRNYCVVKKVATELVGLVEKGKTLQLGEFTVTPFAVPHDSADNVGYSMLTEAGVDSRIIKSIVGHKGQDITEHYTHITLEVKLEAVNLL